MVLRDKAASKRLEGKSSAKRTNVDRVVVTVLIGIENHDQTGSNADIISHSETVESFYVNCGVWLSSLTSRKVALIDEARNISASTAIIRDVTTGNLGRLTDVYPSQVSSTQ